MTNHYHLLVETVDDNLSKGMRQLDRQYTQRFNRRHKMVGHLFQGRYKAILVQKDAYLLELTRYGITNSFSRLGLSKCRFAPSKARRILRGESPCRVRVSHPPTRIESCVRGGAEGAVNKAGEA